MSSVNKILVLFLLTIGVSLLGIWEFVQSEFFASKLSETVTTYTKRSLKADLSFDKIEIKFFPPGVEVNNVELKKNDKKEGRVYAQVSRLGLEFNPFDLFKTDLTIENVYFADGIIDIELHGQRKKQKNIKESNNIKEILKDIKITSYIDQVKKSLPFFIKNIELNKIKVLFNENSLITHYSRVSIYDDSVSLALELRDFNLSKIKLMDEVVDEFDLKLRFYDKELKIRKIFLSKGMNKIELTGEVQNYLDLDNIEYEIESELKGHISVLHNYLKFKEVGELRSGYLDLKSSAKGNLKAFNIKNRIELFNIDTDFVTGDKLVLDLTLNQDNIVFNQFSLYAGNGNLKLDQPFEFYNFKSGKFVEEDILVTAVSLPASNALKFLEDTLGIIKGNLNGKIRFILDPESFYFKIDKGLFVEKLKLVTDEKSSPILNIDKVQINKGYFDIIKGNVFIGLNLGVGSNNFEVTGSVKNGKVLFSSKNSKINLEDLGKIAGFDIRGKSYINFNVEANDLKNIFKIDASIENFSFESFYQDELKTSLIIDFNENSLALKKTRAKTGQTVTSGDFKLLLTDLTVKSNIKQSKISIRDIKKMYAPALKKIDLSEEDYFGDWETIAEIKGKLNLNDLIVNGKFVGQNNYVYGESLDLVKLNYNLENSIFSLNDAFISKASGGIKAGFKFNISNSDMLFFGNINKIPLSQINNYNKLPLTLRGNLSGLFKGKINKDGNQLYSEININNSTIHNKKIGDSYIKLSINDQKIDFTTSLLGNQIKSGGNINLEKTMNNNSQISLKLDSQDLNRTLSILSFVDHLKTGFTGQLKVDANIAFNPWNINKASGKINLNRLILNKGLLNVNYTNRESSQFVVESGEIKKWDLNIRGGKFFIVSKGEGNLLKDYDIKSRVKISASILEIFNVLISKSSGTLRGSIHNFKQEDKDDYVAKIVSSNLSMNSDFLPVELKNGELLINYKDQKFLLNKLRAELNTGTFDLKGQVDISRIIPDINIRYKFENAGIPLLKKSFVSFSGKGSFVGRTIPYTLGGEIQVQKCSIVNEITDFAGGEEVVKSDVDYLPQNKSKALNQFINFNLNINTIEPIRITNSMADLGFSGNLLLSGGEKEPRLEGKIGLAPMQNQIFFKNNVFNLSKGNVFFYERNKITNPELDFKATSTINKYNLNLSVLGPVKDFKLSLYSDPVLSQSDILSLIAFGYTEDLSTNLTDNEKESMTRAGVGSIIFDRFKINETLKNEFGLQVNLGTQISQEEGSYLSQRNAQGADVGRVRSATTIEIKKQVSEAVNLSVSSTVGGSVGQRQSMNLNYNLNKNLSLEGVYESNTEAQSEDLNNDSSLGADVKIRWSFR